MKVKIEREVAQSCPTLYDPIDGSPIPGILQARVLEWGAIAFSALAPYLPITTTCSFFSFSELDFQKELCMFIH